MGYIDYSKISMAVLVPCYNEEKTIKKVIQDFQRELPTAQIYVFDNNSTDNSLKFAQETNAIVIKEKRQGKGFVIQSMLKKVLADVYIMVDADDTYPAERVHDLLSPLFDEEADMVVGQRLSDYSENAFPPLHYSGNKIICNLINGIFKSNLKDPMSGYRAFSREVVRELPVVASGFDVETEMTLQMLYRNFKIIEVEIPYRERPEGSVSKLNTFKDGFKVLYKILSIMQAYKPLTFFGGIGLILIVLGLAVGSYVINEFALYQYIYSVPKAILAVGLVLSGLLTIIVGIVLHSLNFRLLELSNNAAKLFSCIETNNWKTQNDK